MYEGHGLIVLLWEVVQTFPFYSWNIALVWPDLWVWLLHLWCSQFSFDNEPLSKPFLYFSSFLSVKCSRPLVGDLCFNQWACMLNVWACFYMMNSPFKGWHMVVTLAWWIRILILAWTLQQKFPEWQPMSPLSPKLKMGLPLCKTYIKSIYLKGKFLDMLSEQRRCY